MAEHRRIGPSLTALVLLLLHWSLSAGGAPALVWPHPQAFSSSASSSVAWVDSGQGARVELPGGTGLSEVLVEGARRYASLPSPLLFPFGSAAAVPPAAALPLVVGLSQVSDPRNGTLALGVDESYALSVALASYGCPLGPVAQCCPAPRVLGRRHQPRVA